MWGPVRWRLRGAFERNNLQPSRIGDQDPGATTACHCGPGGSPRRCLSGAPSSFCSALESATSSGSRRGDEGRHGRLRRHVLCFVALRWNSLWGRGFTALAVATFAPTGDAATPLPVYRTPVDSPARLLSTRRTSRCAVRTAPPRHRFVKISTSIGPPQRTDGGTRHHLRGTAAQAVAHVRPMDRTAATGSLEAGVGGQHRSRFTRELVFRLGSRSRRGVLRHRRDRCQPGSRSAFDPATVPIRRRSPRAAAVARKPLSAADAARSHRISPNPLPRHRVGVARPIRAAARWRPARLRAHPPPPRMPSRTDCSGTIGCPIRLSWSR